MASRSTAITDLILTRAVSAIAEVLEFKHMQISFMATQLNISVNVTQLAYCNEINYTVRHNYRTPWL